MIDYEKSSKLNGMGVDNLKDWFLKYPQSNKNVIRVCDGCGEEREICFQAYRGLCRKCTMNLPEVRKNSSIKATERFSDQSERDKMSEIRIQYYIDNPEALVGMSEIMIEYNKTHPEFLERNAEMWREYWSDQDHKDKMSEIITNSEAAKIQADKQRGGLDLCWHHIAYDFGRPDALRVLITRKFHSQIHNPKGWRVGTHGYSLID